jgi:hypothetical protein
MLLSEPCGPERAPKSGLPATVSPIASHPPYDRRGWRPDLLPLIRPDGPLQPTGSASQGFVRSVSSSDLTAEPERPLVSLAIPAPRLATGFGARAVPAVPPRALRHGPACACCPDLRRRYLSKIAAACPGPPRAFPAGSPSRGVHAGRAKRPPEFLPARNKL